MADEPEDPMMRLSHVIGDLRAPTSGVDRPPRTSSMLPRRPPFWTIRVGPGSVLQGFLHELLSSIERLLPHSVKVLFGHKGGVAPVISGGLGRVAGH